MLAPAQADQPLRPSLLALSSASVIEAFAILSWLDTSGELLALIVAMAVGLIVALAITLVWKLSIHLAAGAVVILMLVFGPALVVLAPVVVLVAWARVELGDHTVEQVAAGAVIGAVVAGRVFTVLR